MSATIAKIDLDSLSDFQQELHSPATKDEALSSPFVRVFQKSTWRSNLHHKSHCQANENDFTYDTNPSFHYLRRTYMRTNWPALRVRKEYEDRIQICWPHNLGTSHIQTAALRLNEDVLNSFDNIWCDIYFQFFMKPGFREAHNQNIGNLPFLEEWGNSLPEYTTNVHQPYYYCRDDSLAFPLLLLNSQSKLTRHYRMKTRIQDILRMRGLVRIKNDKGELLREEWKEIKCELAYLEGAGPSGQLKTPELWDEYTFIGEEERNSMRAGCVDNKYPYIGPDGKEVPDDFEYRFYIEDVMPAQSINKSNLGSAAVVELACEKPAKYIAWVAENLTAKDNRNTSNYTTNSENLYMGWNPCSVVSLHYGGQPRLENMDADHFDKMTPWYKTLSPACDPGYNIHCIADTALSLDADIAITLGKLKARLDIVLNDTNPHLKPLRIVEDKDKKPFIDELDIVKTTSGREKDSDSYRVHVRMVIIRKICFHFIATKNDFTVKVY